MNQNELVSVIIPTYNRNWCIKRAIDSVLGQDYPYIEVIIVDDGSSDETLDTIYQYLENEKVYLLHTPHRGVSAARNKGIAKARGQWICFLDSDDEWLSHKISSQMDFAHNNPLYKIIHGEEIWVRNGKRVNPKLRHRKGGGNQFERSLELCVISPSTVMIHRDLFEKVGMFDEEMIVCEDYDLWLRITLHYPVGFINDPLIVKYGGHEDQLSHQYKAMDFYRVKALRKLLDYEFLDEKLENKIKREMAKKTSIVLNGHKKHQKLSLLSEMEEIWKEYMLEAYQ